MIETLKEMWGDNKIAFIFLLFCLLFVIGLLGFLGFIMVDSVGVEDKMAEAVIINKEYHSAYTTTGLMPCGKSFITTVQYHPERYEVVIKIADGRIGSLCVTSDVYNTLTLPRQTKVSYSCGRLSSNIYLHNFIETP